MNKLYIPFLRMEAKNKINDYDAMFYERKSNENYYDLELVFDNKGIGPAINPCVEYIDDFLNIDKYISATTPIIPEHIIGIDEKSKLLLTIDKNVMKNNNINHVTTFKIKFEDIIGNKYRQKFLFILCNKEDNYLITRLISYKPELVK